MAFLWVPLHLTLPSNAAASHPTAATAAANRRKPNSSGNLNTAQQQTDKKQQSQKRLNNKTEGKKTQQSHSETVSCQTSSLGKCIKRKVQGGAISITQHSASGFFPSIYNDKLTGAGIEQNMEDFHKKNQDTVARLPWTQVIHELTFVGT